MHETLKVPRITPRSLWPAVRRGMACRCPQCGKGHLYKSYLKTDDSCQNCGLDLRGHQADDAPPYLVITVVGHIIISAMLWVEIHHSWSVETHLMVWLPLTLALTLTLLPPMKGIVVAWQWALRMHGFEKNTPSS